MSLLVIAALNPCVSAIVGTLAIDITCACCAQRTLVAAAINHSFGIAITVNTLPSIEV